MDAKKLRERERVLRERRLRLSALSLAKMLEYRYTHNPEARAALYQIRERLHYARIAHDATRRILARRRETN